MISIPEKMQAVQLDESEGSVSVRQIPIPRPGPGEVLIRMAASPINPSDLFFLQGNYPVQKPFPVVPGLEGSGTVVARGPGLLPRLWMGKRVACAAAPIYGGTWAEYMVTPARLCFPLHKKLSLEQGAMLIVNPMTALAFFDIVKRDKHKAVVNTAAAGALGRMILRLGQTHEIPVINIVRKVEQAKLLYELGAEHVLQSGEPEFTGQLRALAQQLEATLFLDAVAGEQTQGLLGAAPSGSTVLVYANLSGDMCQINSRTLLSGDKRLEGFYLANWAAKKSLLQILRDTQRVQRLVETVLQSNVQARYAFADVQQALDLYSSHMTGVLLLPN
jgi:NADPH:quinone reductase-like Zn-dependent oxidoreductase